MFSEDYVLRQISQAMAVIARVLGLIKAGQHQQAAAMIDQEIEELLGLDPAIAKALDDAALVSLLTTGQGLDCAKLFVLADLFKLEGDLLRAQKRDADSRSRYQQALALFDAFSLQCPAGPETDLADRINELQALVNAE